MRALLFAVSLIGLAASAQTPANVSEADQAAARAAFDRLQKIDPGTPENFAGPDAGLFPEIAMMVRDVRAMQPGWRRDLRARVARDQFWRETINPDVKDSLGIDTTGKQRAFDQLSLPVWREVDEANTAWLKAEIDRRGAWPPRSEIGEVESMMMWLLVQHADRDKEFQKRALTLMEPLVATKEVSGSNYAYLWDRVATGEGRPQRYGTQGACVPDAGRWEPRAIDDRANVDARRKTADMGTLAEYMDQINSRGVCR